MKTRRFWMLILSIAFLMGLVLGGCGGSDGKDGKSAYDIAVENGFEGTEEEWLELLYGGGAATPGEGSWFGEYCNSCHEYDGLFHQAKYDELYQVGVIEVSNIDYAYSMTTDTDTVTFEMTKFGNPFDCTDVGNLNIYYSDYTGTGFEMDDRLSLKSKVSYISTTNECQSVAARSTTVAALDLGALDDRDGFIAVFGRDGDIGTIPGTRVRQNRYPYGAVEVYGTVDYTSAAYEPGCQKCHTKPFLKHGYELADVGVPGLEFYLCKSCHLENGEGGHFIWQLLVDDPSLIIDLEEDYGEDNSACYDEDDEYVGWEDCASAEGDPRLDRYAYRTRLMNDVHMSHAMEFPYPQSMSTCATCHEGSLGAILTEDNFTLETCKSCHPVTGDPQNIMEAPALYDVMPTSHVTAAYIDTTDYSDASPGGCNVCHTDISAMAFDTIHTGYDDEIYTEAANGTKYADSITVSIDNVSLNGYMLSIAFSATGSADGGAVDSADIVPTVLVGLYGQGTKDFLVGPHARDIDGERNLELEMAPGESNPRYSVVDSSAPTWEVVADLSFWAHLIDDGTIWRAEIGIMPALPMAGTAYSEEEFVALNAVSETFDLDANDFTEPVADIVDVENGCNLCHDALATTFHSPDRGGSIEICRLCHFTLSGGSHLELQSRSIDSYLHAIHAFQPFNVGRSLSDGGIDFTDPVEELHYEHHTGFIFPTLGFDCEACHKAGTYVVPSQYDSMPGLLSPSGDGVLELGWEDREIQGIPETVTGPAGRACGSCHKVEYINEDNAVELEKLNDHIEAYGYMWENDSDDVILNFIIDMVFSVYAP